MAERQFQLKSVRLFHRAFKLAGQVVKVGGPDGAILGRLQALPHFLADDLPLRS